MFLNTSCNRDSAPPNCKSLYRMTNGECNFFCRKLLTKVLNSPKIGHMKSERVEQNTFPCTVKIPFRTEEERQRFVGFCDTYEHTQGGYVRLAVLEKLSRDEREKSRSRS